MGQGQSNRESRSRRLFRPPGFTEHSFKNTPDLGNPLGLRQPIANDLCRSRPSHSRSLGSEGQFQIQFREPPGFRSLLDNIGNDIDAEAKFRRVHSSRSGRKRPSRCFRLIEQSSLELLERRVLPAVTAMFSAAHGVLTIIGNAHDNTIAISRKPGGTILVNGHAVAVRGAEGHSRQHKANPGLRGGRQRQSLPE